MTRQRMAYERVQMARDKDRPKITDYISSIFTDFLELSGDRKGGEDRAVLGGIALLEGRPVTVIGHRKGRTLQENLSCRFGMASPEGYRKAFRLMKEAEKFRRPVITFIDTPGAYPGMEAEEHGQSAAIAENLAMMSALKVPTVSIVTGEGSSGGALAIGVTDEIWMLENAVYSILSPEGFASIIWKDSGKADQAASLMHLTAGELYDSGIVDRVISEGDGIRKAFPKICGEIRRELVRTIGRLEAEGDALTEHRYEKYRHIEGSLAPFVPGAAGTEGGTSEGAAL